MKLIAGCGMQKIEGSGHVVVDLSMNYLRRNSETQKDIHHFVQVDLRFLPFKKGVFENIECIDVIEHIDQKAATIRELSRVSLPGRTELRISAALASANRFFGTLSRTYRKRVTLGFHSGCLGGKQYEKIIADRFTIRIAEYRCCAFPILVALLMDPLSVEVNEAGEYTGRHRDRLFAWAQFIYPFVQPFFNVLGYFLPEALTQSAYYECIATPHMGTIPRKIGFHKPIGQHLRSYLR